MDKLSKKRQKIRVWQWITAFAVFLSLISGCALLVGWWKTQQINTQIQEKEQQLDQVQKKQQAEQVQAYQNQQKQLPRVLALTQNPSIHQFFSDFLQNYSYRFAKKHNLTDYCLSLNFGGFYQEKMSGISHQDQVSQLGSATFNPVNQQATIYLNQDYLFNKLGYERYFANPELCLDINFADLMKTCAHELAHYIQYVKYGQSSCQSDYGTSQYIPWLSQEQEQLTKDIYQMIINSNEYPILEKRWKEIK